MSGLLGGLGLFGILVAAFFGFLVLLLLPWWAILDCAFSRRTRAEKVVAIALLVFTWGLGSVVYGAFVTRSRLLRWTTVLTVGGVLAVLVPSIAALLTGAGMGAKEQAERRRQEQQAVAAAFRPGTIPAAEVAEFHALHLVSAFPEPASAAVARFTGAALDAASARDTDRRLRHLAVDPSGPRYWGLTAQEVGAIDAGSGRFAAVEVEPALEFSWPQGVAFDAAAGDVVVMTSHVDTRFYRFTPATAAWRRLPAELRDVPVTGLAAIDGVFYAVEYRPRDLSLRRLQRFNREGASLGPIELVPPVPVADGAEPSLQLQTAGTALVLMLPDGLFVIDPRTGTVRVPTTAR